MELILIGIVFILFGVSLWWDWKQMDDLKERIREVWSETVQARSYLGGRLDRIDHDNQQLKHRLTTIKRTTKKDLKAETKPRRFRGV